MKRLITILWLATIVQLATVAIAQSQYTHAFLWTSTEGMQDLGVLRGYQNSGAYGINNSGEIVGVLSNTTSTTFRWKNTTGLRLLPGATDSFDADALNASGAMAGDAEFPPGRHATLWTQTGGAQDLGTLGGSACQYCSSYAFGISSSGEVVGTSSTKNVRVQRAFVWTAAKGMVTLPTLGGTVDAALGINASGQIVGGSMNHAVLWSSGKVVDLGTLEGPAGTSSAYAINDSGMVVGYSSAYDGTGHAFLWTPTAGMTDLGALPDCIDTTVAVAINSHGDVAGWCYTATGSSAFIWTASTGMQDLGNLGGTYTFAYGINDADEIVGGSTIP